MQQIKVRFIFLALSIIFALGWFSISDIKLYIEPESIYIVRGIQTEISLLKEKKVAEINLLKEKNVAEINLLKEKNVIAENKIAELRKKRSYQEMRGDLYETMWNGFYSHIYNRPMIPCPPSADVILVAGQSNAANHVVSHKYENKLHVNYFHGSCYPLENPVLGATSGINVYASVVPAIASKLTSKKPYIFLTTGWGGTSISKWGVDNSELSSNTNHHLKELEKLGSKLNAIVWIQGEADANKEIDYKKNFYGMKKILLKGLSNNQNVKFVITQTSKCGNQPRDIKLNKQQLQLGNDENTYVTEVTDNLDNSFRHDDCHFNALGVEIIAKEISSLLNGILKS